VESRERRHVLTKSCTEDVTQYADSQYTEMSKVVQAKLVIYRNAVNLLILTDGQRILRLQVEDTSNAPAAKLIYISPSKAKGLFRGLLLSYAFPGFVHLTNSNVTGRSTVNPKPNGPGMASKTNSKIHSKYIRCREDNRENHKSRTMYTLADGAQLTVSQVHG
jgi:hypothetical protein